MSTPTLPLPPSTQPTDSRVLMPGKVNPSPTSPGPADPGNPNAPATPAAPPTPTGVQMLDAGPLITVVVNGRPIGIYLNNLVQLDSSVKRPPPVGGTKPKGNIPSPRAQDVDTTDDTVLHQIQSIQDWYKNAGVRRQIVNQMYQAGLITSTKNPSASEVAKAWALLVQEASLQGNITPQDLLAKAATGGWNALQPKLAAADADLSGNGNPGNAQDTTSETTYKSYLDPATVMGALADSYFRLVGRNPTQAEYQGFLNTVYGYQQAENTGKFETKDKDPTGADTGLVDPSTGQPVAPGNPNGPVTQTNVVSQRGIGLRGLQFLAGQSALANPEEGSYQAATTYFNAFIKALSGPAAGMQASGPTTTVP